MAVVSDYTALLSGNSWWGYQASTEPVFIAYSFETSAQPYLAADGFSAQYLASFEAFSASEQTLARQALQQWANASGVTFFEVPAGQGDIRFAQYDFSYDPGQGGFAGYAYYPNVVLAPDTGWDDPTGGDVFINTDYPTTLGLLLHEIGHALGLKHPFDDDPTLAANLDNSSHTVMSYSGPDPTVLAHLDIDAIRALYGLPASDGTQVSSWSWDASTYTLTQGGGAAADTIRGVSTSDVMAGNGGNDVLFGSFGNDRLDGGMGDDSLFGGPGSDVLVGGPGNDLLEGLSGYNEFDSGVDTADYSSAAQPINVDLRGTFTVGHWVHAQGGDIGSDELRDIANVIGGAGADSLIGDDGANVLTGGAGSDTLNGLGGSDTAGFGSYRAEYDVRTIRNVSSVLETKVIHQGGSQTGGTDTLSNIEALQFLDHGFALAGAQLNDVANVAGTRFDDVLFQSATSGQVLVMQMWGGGPNGWSVGTGVLGTDWKALATGDLNPALTGGAEIFVQQQSTGTIYYASHDTGPIVWGVVSASLTPDWKLRAAADLTSDTTADVIVQNQVSGTIYYADVRDGVFHGWGLVNANVTGDWVAVGAGDINRDGFADVVVQSQSTGTTYYASMYNGGFSGWGTVSANLTADWKVKAVADLTGDGFADVIFQQASTGTTYYADMQDGALNHWGVVANNITAAWSAEGAADVDNDGYRDVLFQNATNGTTYYAHMGAAGFEGWGVVASNISPDWHVV